MKCLHPDDNGSQDLITQWYLRDDNAIPPVYVLQPISTAIPEYDEDHGI